MKKYITLIISFILLLVLVGCGEDNSGQGNINQGAANGNITTESVKDVRVKITIGAKTAFLKLKDCTSSRELVMRLKKSSLELNFSDFAGSEKIATPSPLLDVSNTSGCNPEVGDVTIYKPWGNFAVFYKDTSEYSKDLTLIGRIEDEGIKIFSEQKNSFNVIMELID